jgi:dihydroxyacetone kinase-like protein
MKFNNTDGGTILTALVKAIQENKQYLSDIDGLIGDGDHGINMNKGFTIFGQQLAAEPVSFSQGLGVLSKTLMTKIGGSMGPLYGFLFKNMASACDGVEAIDAAVFGKMMIAGKEGIQKVSQAQVGDKTLVDVLLPAEQAYQGALQNGKNFAECLDAMVAAAVQGREATKDMIAKVGRSSRLGERSRGVIDAGSASCCLILETMSAGIKGLLNPSGL